MSKGHPSPARPPTRPCSLETKYLYLLAKIRAAGGLVVVRETERQADTKGTQLHPQKAPQYPRRGQRPLSPCPCRASASQQPAATTSCS